MTFDLEKARAMVFHYGIMSPGEIDTDCGLYDLVRQANLAEEALDEIERLRAENLELQGEVFGPDGIRANQACIIADQAASISELEIEITELKADLEQSEEIKRLKDELENYGDHYACLLISKDAQIKELVGMLDARSKEIVGRIQECQACQIDQLRAEGKIGSRDHSSDATKKVWQITEERTEALQDVIDRYDVYDRCLVTHDWKVHVLEVLQAMLKEVE